MFYAIPLESRPTWRNPPWVTVLLILVNMLVFWGPQRAEKKAEQARAAQFYLQSEPAEAGAAALRRLAAGDRLAARARGPAAAGARALRRDLLEGLQQEKAFLRKLHADQVIDARPPAATPSGSASGSATRRMLPPPFTTRWAQDHNPDAEFKPWTWVTSAFLHGSTGHLLGNMLFLFLFGFSVELALGRGLYLGFYLLGAVGASALAAWAYAGKGGYGLGASGAVSALMGMYAVMYRLRRIRFFYQLFFYFNYVTAPALILLPAWIANELLQHLVGGKGIAYMAHLGGLLTGALLMAGAMRWRRVQPARSAGRSRRRTRSSSTWPSARRLAGEMKFEQACAEWRAAAKLRPDDADTLRAWFNTAKLWPAGEDFHRAAHRIFQAPAAGPRHAGTAACELQDLPRSRQARRAPASPRTWRGWRAASRARSSSPMRSGCARR